MNIQLQDAINDYKLAKRNMADDCRHCELGYDEPCDCSQRLFEFNEAKKVLGEMLIEVYVEDNA
jgi:hypothetical protein